MEYSASEQKAISELAQRMPKGRTEASATSGHCLITRPTDVIISSGLKAGTTWLQQICHQLRSGGDMDFQEIGDVVPFLEMAQDLGVSTEGDQKYLPRFFKTHFWEPHTPAGCRYIVIARHPHDCAVSFFHFLQGWFFTRGDLSIDTFTNVFFLGLGAPQSHVQFPSIFHHLASWWPKRYNEEVLWLFYEDLREDLPREVKRIANFLHVTDEKTIATAVERSTFAYMKQHEAKFDENRAKRMLNPGAGLPLSAGDQGSKVRVAGGQREQLSQATRTSLDAKWMEICSPVVGANCYDDLRRQWKAEHTQIDN